MFCPIVERFSRQPTFFHPAVPASIADRLEHLHGAPAIWFTGHLLAYVMRLQEGEVVDTVNMALQAIRKPSTGTASPVVGLHIRRTDKVGVSNQISQCLDQVVDCS